MSQFLVLLACVSVASAASVGFGACPAPPKTIQNFDLNQFSGHWYEVQRYFNILESLLKCITIDYIQYNSTNFRAEERSLLIVGNIPVADIRNGSIVESKNSAVIEWGGVNVWILDTDYKNFAALWSCGNKPVPNQTDAWILSRTANLTSDLLARAHNAYARANLPVPAINATRDSNCKP